MKREEFARRLREETDCVHASQQLMQRTLRAAQGKEQKVYMKKKISLAIVFTLIAVMLGTAALAAASRWGMLDFMDRYAVEHYIPEDAQTYVETNVAAMENEWVTVNVRELYYDGRTSRMTVDVTPKDKNVLIVGEDVSLSDPFINLTHEYVMDGENDMRSVYEVIQDKGYEQVYVANVSLTSTAGGMEGMIAGSMDYILGDDGTLTIFCQEEYAQDVAKRDAAISVIVMPFDQPLTPESYANYDKRDVLETPITLTASVNPTDAPAQDGQIANVYVSDAPVEYENVGVRIDRVLLEVKPQEIYATVEYSVTDQAKYDATDGGLWFEFIDPQKEGAYWEQRLAAGLSGGGSAGPIDNTQENPTKFRQTEMLGKNELREVYTLRAFDAWEKERYETHEITVRPATAENLAQ